MGLVFRKEVEKGTVLNPSRGFAPVEVSLETRWDPLTGETSRVFEVPWQREELDLRELFKAGLEGSCPFCPENLPRVTPKFPQEFIPEGRLMRDSVVVFPNQRPFDKVAAVVVLGERHFVTVGEVDLGVLLEGLLAARDFLRLAADRDPSLRAFSIHWNLLPPAGGSVVHPHLHALAGGYPPNQMRRTMEASSAYLRAHGRSFWGDLWEEERRRGERFLGEVDGIPWLLPFAPKGYGEVMALFPGEGSLLGVSGGRLRAFVKGLGCLFRFWADYGVYSFNLVLFGGEREPKGGFWVHARAFVRRLIPPTGASDLNALNVLHDQPVVYALPERLCARMRPYFEVEG